MGADKSRVSFAPVKLFSGVHKQQGRVTLDSEFNEFEEILDRRDRAEMYDTTGPAAVPMMTPHGFEITVGAGPELRIGVGRAYVDGILVECFGDMSVASNTVRDDHIGGVHGPHDSGDQPIPLDYDKQPFYYAKPVAFPALNANPTDLVYLEVWQREVTVFEDPALREIALNGPDTATRVQTAWQVKLMHGAGPMSCATPPQAWTALTAPSTARLTVGTKPVVVAAGPCVIDPAGGYTGIENRLYRVEVHDSGPLVGANPATFKWSRDNASLMATVEAITKLPASAAPALSSITVRTTGPDSWRRFEKDDHIEMLDDNYEFAMRERGTGGRLARIVSVDHTAGEIEVDVDLSTLGFDMGRHPRIRRWDVKNKTEALVREATPGTAVELEEGITVTFGSLPTDTLHAGDYWVFAARTADGTPELLTSATPRGLHHFGRLALYSPSNSPQVSDCRKLFPPLSELTELYYVGGDGQEAVPAPFTSGENAKYPLPQPFEVGVANGEHPVPSATVKFTVVTTGSANLGTTPNTQTLIVPTGPDGVASCQLFVDPAVEVHRVRAELVDAADIRHGLPIDFTATVPLQLQYVGGDAQTMTRVPGKRAIVSRPLQVAVVCGRQPAPNRRVRFAIPTTGGGGELLSGTLTPGPQLDVLTDSFGVAAVTWRLDDVSAEQFVEARLLFGVTTFEPPIRFRARLGASFGYGGGDGQQSRPSEQLRYPLEAIVLDPPYKDRRVRFTTNSGKFSLADGGTTVASPLEVPTDLRGVAKCFWTLDGTTDVQRATAQRLDDNGDVLDPPINYTARLLRQEDEQGIHVVGVTTTRPIQNDTVTRKLVNDSDILTTELAQGIRIQFDQDVISPLRQPGTVDPDAFNPANFVVSAEVPHPASTADMELWDGPQSKMAGLVAYNTLQLRANVGLTPNKPTEVVWKPSDEAMTWLRSRLFQRLWMAGVQDTKLLLRLTLHGNFIWGKGESEKKHRYLDGETFGTLNKDAAGNPIIDLLAQAHTPSNWLSGDGKRGGDFRMWFWLKRMIRSVAMPHPKIGNPWFATVRLVDQAPEGGVRLRLAQNPPDLIKFIGGPVFVIPAGAREITIEGTFTVTWPNPYTLTVTTPDGDVEVITTRP